MAHKCRGTTETYMFCLSVTFISYIQVVGQCQDSGGAASGKINESAASNTLFSSVSIPVSCPTSESPGD